MSRRATAPASSASHATHPPDSCGSRAASSTQLRSQAPARAPTGSRHRQPSRSPPTASRCSLPPTTPTPSPCLPGVEQAAFSPKRGCVSQPYEDEKDGCVHVGPLVGPTSIAVSPDGVQLYVTGESGLHRLHARQHDRRPAPRGMRQLCGVLRRRSDQRLPARPRRRRSNRRHHGARRPQRLPHCLGQRLRRHVRHRSLDLAPRQPEATAAERQHHVPSQP